MDLRQIKNLMKEFEDSKIHKLEITDHEFSIKLEKEDNNVFSSPINDMARQPLASSQVVDAMPVVAEEKVNVYKEVNAPLVGTFYQAPSPDTDPFVTVGSNVKKGDTLFIIEAMKVMNEITSPVSGTIMSINVPDGTMVEYGQIVMEI
jgi:acetyl-CoA carboxylase biotin carboxyl carrier protein